MYLTIEELLGGSMFVGLTLALSSAAPLIILDGRSGIREHLGGLSLFVSWTIARVLQLLNFIFFLIFFQNHDHQAQPQTIDGWVR